jgi:hypothetical protein
VSDRKLGALRGLEARGWAGRRIVSEPLLVLRALAAMTEATEDETVSLHRSTVLAAVALRAGAAARAVGSPPD